MPSREQITLLHRLPARSRPLHVRPRFVRGGSIVNPLAAGHHRRAAAEVYVLPSGHLLRTIAHSAAVSAVVFATADHDLVSGAVDGSLLITRGEADPVALRSSFAGIDAAIILADGRVVVADAGGRLRII